MTNGFLSPHSKLQREDWVVRFPQWRLDEFLRTLARKASPAPSAWGARAVDALRSLRQSAFAITSTKTKPKLLQKTYLVWRRTNNNIFSVKFRLATQINFIAYLFQFNRVVSFELGWASSALGNLWNSEMPLLRSEFINIIMGNKLVHSHSYHL